MAKIQDHMGSDEHVDMVEDVRPFRLLSMNWESGEQNDLLSKEQQISHSWLFY